MNGSSKIHIGIIAPSAKVPSIELKLGVAKLKEEGFSVQVHPQCRKQYLFFAGTDEERAASFLEYAYHPDIPVIWCARGGHGAIRLLSFLDRSTIQNGIPPKKLLIGYSDSTLLLEYVRKNWNWHTLHAPMPSMRKFTLLDHQDWQSLLSWIRRKPHRPPWENQKLEFWSPRPLEPIEGLLQGGNLTVWNCTLGTPFEFSASNSLLFLEDVDESLYRIDRMVQQLLLSQSLKGVRGIILGNFLNCKDGAPLVLKNKPLQKNRIKLLTAPKPKDLKPLRKLMKENMGLRKIFSRIADELHIPVAYGLPVGHGPEVSPLPLGAHYRLTPQGHLKLLNWDWIS